LLRQGCKGGVAWPQVSSWTAAGRFSTRSGGGADESRAPRLKMMSYGRVRWLYTCLQDGNMSYSPLSFTDLIPTATELHHTSSTETMSTVHDGILLIRSPHLMLHALHHGYPFPSPPPHNHTQSEAADPFSFSFSFSFSRSTALRSFARASSAFALLYRTLRFLHIVIDERDERRYS
jgi:hypothetical protein